MLQNFERILSAAAAAAAGDVYLIKKITTKNVTKSYTNM
jgi:hypothetical protein